MQSRKIEGKAMKFEGLNVVVFGAGVSGRSAVKLLTSCNSTVFIVNRSPVEDSKVPFFLEDDPRAKDVMARADLIILSPGIPREHTILEEPLKNGVPIWSEIELGFHFCSLPIAAVTGTNGKTTTVSLIGEMLKASGLKPFVGGNIGRAFCDLPFVQDQYDVAILELSSFQLESIEKFHPRVSALLNVFPNHGERYSSFDDYGVAKINILKNWSKGDRFFCFEDIPANLKKKLSAKEVEYVPSVDNKEIFEGHDLKDFKLPGSHNLQNLLFAQKISYCLGGTQEGVQKTISNFCGVDFRLQFIPSSHSFTCYNDAKSTNWEATLTAVKALQCEKKPLSIILGGAKRGRGDTLPPEFISYKFHKIFLIGETTSDLSNELKKVGISHESCFSLPQVERMIEESFEGNLLFSPAFPSFDQYENYVERGKHFTGLFGNL